MKTNIIKFDEVNQKDNCQRMTSLEIAELTGKQHNDLMKAIRKMEPAWVKIAQGNFPRVLHRQERAAPTLLLTDENRVPVHRHEVQRRGTRPTGAPLAGTGGGTYAQRDGARGRTGGERQTVATTETHTGHG